MKKYNKKDIIKLIKNNKIISVDISQDLNKVSTNGIYYDYVTPVNKSITIHFEWLKKKK